MSSFPFPRTAPQQSAVLFVDAALTELATIRLSDGSLAAGSQVDADASGLWPAFTCDATVLYYRAVSGQIGVVEAALDLVTPRVVYASEGDPESIGQLISALASLGLPISYAAPAAAVIDLVDPDDGSYAGGDPVTLTGSGFTEATAVTFDGVDGTDFVVVSDAEITVTTPAHAPGTVDVVVEDPNGDSDPASFTYGPPVPVITPPLVPATGDAAGGDAVVISGTGFTGATAVTFDGTPGTAFSVVGPTEIHVTTPAHAAGAVDVIVEAPQGDSATAVGAFTYA